VAAFCVCCGAKITLKAEACPACGSPRHGMSQTDWRLKLDGDTAQSRSDIDMDHRVTKLSSLKPR
jgi:hypothetical protein